jgi:hypothetical protein
MTTVESGNPFHRISCGDFLGRRKKRHTHEAITTESTNVRRGRGERGAELLNEADRQTIITSG